MAEPIASDLNMTRSSGPAAVETSTGEQWICLVDNSADEYRFFYRSGPGQAWSEDALAVISVGVASQYCGLFIDVDDQIWVVYREDDNTRIQLGSIQSSVITWDDDFGTLQVDTFGATAGDNSIHVAKVNGVYYIMSSYREQDNEGWVHISSWDGTTQTTLVTRRTNNREDNSSDGYHVADWEHTGDGKTAAGNPDWFFVMSHGQRSDLEFRRMAWNSPGNWNTGTIRTANTPLVDNTAVRGYFDGSQFVIAHPHTTQGRIYVEQRDAGDTVWTVLSPAVDAGNGPDDDNNDVDLIWDPVTKDIWLASTLSNVPIYNRYDRSAGTWDGWTQLTGTPTLSGVGTGQSLHFIRTMSGVILLYHDSADDTIKSESILIYNNDPTAPTVEAPTSGDPQDVSVSLTVDWTFNDPDDGDTQSAYTIRRRVGTGSYEYWNGSGWQASEDGSTKISSATTEKTLSVGWGADSDDDHYYSVKTWDQNDAGPSPWSAETRIVPSAKDNPTITAPTTSVSDPTDTVTWTVDTQTKFRVRVATDAGITDVEYDSGIVVSGVKSHVASFPTEGTRYIQVTTWNDESLASTPDTEDVTVTYDVPPTPTLTATADSPEAGAIRVVIDNGTPGAGEIAANSNDVYRREGDDSTTEIRIATGVAADGTYDDYTPASGVVYKYKIVAIASTGTTTAGAWTA